VMEVRTQGVSDITTKGFHIRMDEGMWQIPNSVLGLTSRILTDLDAITFLSSCSSSAPVIFEQSWRRVPHWPLSLIQLYQVADPMLPNLAWLHRKTARSRYPQSSQLSDPQNRKLDK